MKLIHVIKSLIALTVLILFCIVYIYMLYKYPLITFIIVTAFIIFCGAKIFEDRDKWK